MNSFLLLTKKGYKSFIFSSLGSFVAFNFFLSSLFISHAVLSRLISSSVSSLLLPCFSLLVSRLSMRPCVHRQVVRSIAT